MNLMPDSKVPGWLPGVYGALVAILAVHLLIQVGGRDSFTWMDPYQYFNYASAVAAGGEGALDYPVASSYPLLLGQVLRFGDSIPLALSVNAFWLVVLAGALLWLCRELKIPSLAPAVLLTTMAAPAVLGLSRELYLEFPLTALAALHLAVWLSRSRWSNPARFWAVFGALLFVGFSIKMTYPVFLAGPLAAEAVGLIRGRRWTSLAGLALAAAVPVMAVLGVVAAVSPTAFAYYISRGNTVIPPMRLIGPLENMSVTAMVYYLDQIFRNYLVLLAPVAVLVIWYALPKRGSDAGGLRRDLWLSLAVPLVFFAFIPVREPRHIAPVAVPLVLLVYLGVREIQRPRVRRGLVFLLPAVAAAQYGLAAVGMLPAPYYLDRPMSKDAVLQAMFQSTPGASSYFLPTGEPDADRWRFTRNTVLTGFSPNEALSLTWSLAPGGVYNLDNQARDPSRLIPIGYRHYTDFYLLSAFNTYNLRCGWPVVYETLPADRALASATHLLAGVRGGGDLPAVQGFRPVAKIPWHGEDVIYVYAATGTPGPSYRRQYAEQFLARKPEADPAELNAVFQDMLLDAFLRGGAPDFDAILSHFPQGFTPGGGTMDIYHMPVYDQLVARLNAVLNRLRAQAEP